MTTCPTDVPRCPWCGCPASPEGRRYRSPQAKADGTPTDRLPRLCLPCTGDSHELDADAR